MAHTPKGVDPFTNKFSTKKDAYKIDIPIKKQLPIELTKKPVTLGDHLRRRRIELGLQQKDVAVQIGVTASSIWNWEHGSPIRLRSVAKVVEFLGYNPIPCPEDLIGRLAWYKQVNGLSLNRLGTEMGRDPEQLADWLTKRYNPCHRNREEIEQFLADKHGSLQQFVPLKS